MKISIITVCYNSAETIESTLKSVSSQDYPDIEYIVVDGGSTDATLDIVKRYKNVSILVSEPDEGIYDAMNKGIGLARGDVIGTLNADDFYVGNSVVSDVAKTFEDNTIDACYADLVYVDQNNTDNIVRYWKSKPYQPRLFKQGWMPAHPTFFVKKSVYEKLGVFDLNYKIAADFELLFRLIEKNKIRTMYLPKVIVKMRLGGTTNKNIKNISLQNAEIIHILRSHYNDFSVFVFWLSKIMNRFWQHISRPAKNNN
jgi:glycosyltransferase involved in cell wall biosynthesis